MVPTPIPALKQSLDPNLETLSTANEDSYISDHIYIADSLILTCSSGKTAKYKVKGDGQRQNVFMSKGVNYIKWTHSSDEVL